MTNTFVFSELLKPNEINKTRKIVFVKYLSVVEDHSFVESECGLTKPGAFEQLVLLPKLMDSKYDLILATTGHRIEYYLGYWNDGIV
ncbi:MAG: hypothetical protein WC307_07015 [Candidatus Nanoarchaeia archaeon]